MKEGSVICRGSKKSSNNIEYTKINIPLQMVNQDIWTCYKDTLKVKDGRQCSIALDLATDCATKSSKLATDSITNTVNATESSKQTKMTRFNLRDRVKKGS